MRKIGILDSGLGGFSLLKDLLNDSLEIECFFISDNDNVPYGGKSQAFMLGQIKQMVDRLLLQDVEAIIIACNTATAETIESLRRLYTIPFIGIEPYINYLNHTTDERLALILTEATAESQRFKDLSLKFDPSRQVKIYPLKSLALIIERLYEDEFVKLKELISKELEALDFNKIDSLILGCTHYPLIKNYLENTYNIKTIDPSKFVITQLAKKLSLNKTDLKSTTFHYCRTINGEWLKKKIGDFDIFY